jgi:arylsulfatase A-like enzyme
MSLRPKKGNSIDWIKPKMKIKIVILTFCVGMGLAAFAAEPSARPEKPNVVLMYADDLGWQDVKCYDIDESSPYETPNIDALAEKGVLFRQAYSPAPTCSPSRCAMMSGKHPARIQKTHVLGGQPPTPNRFVDPLMAPWYSGRLGVEEVTLAEALRANGYRTGHSGKWHIAINHHAFPQPKDHGFDVTFAGRGVNTKMNPHRLTGFATTDSKDSYCMDEWGIPRDEVTVNSIRFMEESKEQPFFLYYATWLVHYPIQSRSKELLEKYCDKLGVEFPTDPGYWKLDGQRNPYYCAMVEMLDAYVGQLIDYLETTDDPRWPGHKLIENTYIIFSSDNGGCEGSGETYTDNVPLDKGKSSAKEGGIRVPLIVVGPSIKSGVDTDVLANGLDFYPTILSWTKTAKKDGLQLDGCDLSMMLSTNPTDPARVKDSSGAVRDRMVHHFPHGNAQQSTIRIGDFKLTYNYGQFGSAEKNASELELYRLYRDGITRVDIEESKNLSTAMPEQAQAMKKMLVKELDAMGASAPYFNPRSTLSLPNKDQVCSPLKAERSGNEVTLSFKENGAKVVQCYLMYTLNGGQNNEEWFRLEAAVNADGTVTATLAKGTTHYLFNLVDEHSFMVSYPQVDDMSTVRKKKVTFSSYALSVQEGN